MKKKWTIGDVIDLEYFLGQDNKIQDEKILENRDRRLYLEKIKPLLFPDNMEDPMERQMDKTMGMDKAFQKTLIRLWLFFMEKDLAILPGRIFDGGLKVLRGMLFGAGIFTGLVFCLSLFSYTGSFPLNVSYFFGIILIPQTLLLLFTLAGLFLMTVRRNQGSGFGIYPILAIVVEKTMAKLFHKTLARLSREKQDALTTALGGLRRSGSAHGHLFLWPLFVLMQLFGVGFNLGALGATLGRIAFFDTAFGWQSTLNLSYGFVYRAVSVLALPWSWAFPEGVGFPSLEQIQGTRLILKDGIYNLTTGDLVSWWPFLCFSIVVYALLPRLVLLALGAVAHKRSLNIHSFDTWETKKLVNRLVTPIVTTESGPLHPPGKEIPGEKFEELPEIQTEDSAGNMLEIQSQILPENLADTQVENSVDKLAATLPENPIESQVVNSAKNPAKGLVNNSRTQAKSENYLALVHDDIHDDLFNGCDQDAFKKMIYHRFNCHVGTILRIGVDFNAEIKEITTHGNCVAGIFMLQEAWLPPIRENLKFIKNIRTSAKKIPLVVVLIGKPGLDTLFTGVDTQDKKIWTMKINGLADPFTHVENLVKS